MSHGRGRRGGDTRLCGEVRLVGGGVRRGGREWRDRRSAGGEAIHGRGRVLHRGGGGWGYVSEEGRLEAGGVKHGR